MTSQQAATQSSAMTPPRQLLTQAMQKLCRPE